MPLRYYQDDAATAAIFALQESERVVINLPTGSGKTVTAADIIRRMLPRRCLFLADQDELCSQPLNVIPRHAGIIPALDKAERRASLASRIVVASSQTLSKKNRLERYPPGFFHLAIIDEAHRGADRDKKITDYLKCKTIGITATAFRANMRDLSEYYEEVAYSMPLINLITEGFAPPILVETIPVEIDLTGVATKSGPDGKDYDLQGLSTTIAPYYRKIAEIIKEKASDRKTIVFLPLIESSKAFAQICREVGLISIHIDGKTDDRDAIQEAFRHGRYQVLCNANVLETGVDLPNADCIVSLTPTHSRVKYQQRIGRGCRVLPGVIDDIPDKDQAEQRIAAIAASAKPNVLILDFLWQHDRLGSINPGHIFAANSDDAAKMFEKIKQIRTPEDMARIALLVQREREAALVKQLEKVVTGKRVPVEPSVLGILLKSPALVGYEPESDREAEPATDAQLKRLAEMGVDADQITCKGEASKLLSVMFFRQRFKFATVGQLERLHALGIPYNPWKLTAVEAEKLITATALETIAA